MTTKSLTERQLADLVDVNTAATICGLTVRTTTEYGRLGILPSVKIGNNRIYSRAALAAWVRQRDARRAARLGAPEAPTTSDVDAAA